MVVERSPRRAVNFRKAGSSGNSNDFAVDHAPLAFTTPHDQHVPMPDSDLDNRVYIAYVS
jgi:hypothetical protein